MKRISERKRSKVESSSVSMRMAFRRAKLASPRATIRRLRDGYMDVCVCTPRGRVLQSDELDELEPQQGIDGMAKG